MSHEYYSKVRNTIENVHKIYKIFIANIRTSETSYKSI